MITISGNVTNPVTSKHETEGVVELLHPTNSRECLYSAVINGDGFYNLEEIDAGSYLLFCSVWAGDTKYYWEIPLKLKDDESKIHLDLLADTAQTLDQI